VKHTLVQCSLAFALVLGAAGAGPAADLGLITGSEKGTYYQFGLDLQKLGKQTGTNLTVYPSRGSVENVYAVYQRPGVQMGIVQSDVLAFVAKIQTDPTLAKIAQKTKLIFPLYNEEVHLLGRREIVDFDDLGGRRVAIGREGSGTYLTVRLLFKLSDVVPAEMVPIDTGEALAALKAGRIDAMFYVAGYPVKLLTEDVTAADGLALIPILNKSVREFYPPAEIPASTYAWQGTPVSTVAVKAVLVSYDFRTRDCDTVGRFGQTLSTMMDWLRKNGHPKWKAVDLGYPLQGWEQYDCVRRYLGKPVPTPRGEPTTVRGPAAVSPMTVRAAGERHSGIVASVNSTSLVLDEFVADGKQQKLHVGLTPLTRAVLSERNPHATEAENLFTNTPIQVSDIKPGDFVVVGLSGDGKMAESVTVTLRAGTAGKSTAEVSPRRGN
jgi:uncharacterized protein